MFDWGVDFMRESLDIQFVLVVVVVVVVVVVLLLLLAAAAGDAATDAGASYGAAPEIWAESSSMGICRSVGHLQTIVLPCFLITSSANTDSKNVKPQKQEHPKRANSWRKKIRIVPSGPISSHPKPISSHLNQSHPISPHAVLISSHPTPISPHLIPFNYFPSLSHTALPSLEAKRLVLRVFLGPSFPSAGCRSPPSVSTEASFSIDIVSFIHRVCFVYYIAWTSKVSHVSSGPQSWLRNATKPPCKFSEVGSPQDRMSLIPRTA